MKDWHSSESIGVVLLAGGRGRRMGGVDKALLPWRGDTFLQRLARETAGFREVLLSVDSEDRFPDCGLERVVDEYPGGGPLGGLAGALRRCRSEALLAVAVDMPLFVAGAGEYVAAFYGDGCDAVAAVTRDGRIQPLCAVYSKRCLPVLERRLASGNLRMRDALAELRVRCAPLEHSKYPDSVLANVNTPEEYAALRRQSGAAPVIAVCGVKNSGKTTLLVRVVPLLVKKGLRVGVIKHDGHDFAPDVPGTDSFRLREAGAANVAVYSASRFMATGLWECGGPDLTALIAGMGGVDVILHEGGKRSPFPKIEVVRAANGGKLACDPSALLGVCTDAAALNPAGVPVFGLNDGEGVTGRILDFLANGA